MPRRIHIDREEELRLFGDVLAGRCPERILLFEGASQTGKSTLLDEFRKQCGAHPWALVNFKSMTYGAMEFLGELAESLSPLAFDQFQATCARLAAGAVVTITGNRLIGAQVDVVLGALDENQRQAQRAVLTEAFFADLREADARAVIVIDTFEKAASDVREWIGGVFLQRAYRTPGVVAVIAGQSVPALDREWDECCCHRHLSGLQPEDWREYAQRVGAPLSQETVFAFHQRFEGIPGEMEKTLLMFAEGGAR